MNMTVCVVVLSTLLRLLPFAAGDTAITFTVLDGASAPVRGMVLTIRDSAPRDQTVTTDAQGIAVAHQLVGPFFVVTTARRADGRVVPVDATTLDDGLRLGVIPEVNRPVTLRVDNNLVFVDPDTIFSDAGSVPAPTPTATLPSSAATVLPFAVEPIALPDTTEQPTAWGPGVVLLAVLGVLLLVVAVLWLLQVIRYQRQRRVQ